MQPEFDEKQRKALEKEKMRFHFVCPGIAARKFNAKPAATDAQYGPGHLRQLQLAGPA